jgi:hypothetical protein
LFRDRKHCIKLDHFNNLWLIQVHRFHILTTSQLLKILIRNRNLLPWPLCCTVLWSTHSCFLLPSTSCLVSTTDPSCLLTSCSLAINSFALSHSLDLRSC